MQSLESAFGKALHQPMPFTTGGQTITDRLTAAKHSLAGSQLGKTICKATTEELSAPKKKHCDYLLHCTNEPNVSIPSMANLLIERTQNPNWIVVYKALITIHNLMCYGNERFSQYLASCNTTFNLSNFMDKANLQTSAMAAGYDMSMHVRRYGKYISEKIHTYRLCAFDFCKVKRGRDDGLLRTMHADKLLKTMPILQNQIDALLEFQVSSSELNNGVINCSFILLFRDLIRLFACYNDGVINLLEKFFDMNRKQCREALDMYKAFLFRLDKVSDFLRVAETVGIDRGEIPDLTRAPASLLEALEAHLYHLEGGKGPPPTSSAQQMVNQQIYQQSETFNAFAQNTPAYGGTSGGIGAVDDMTKQKYLEEEKERIRQYEEQQRQKQQQLQQQQPNAQAASTNPFGGAPPSDAPADGSGAPNDLLSFLDVPKKNGETAVDPTNPFASALFDPSQSAGTGGVQQASAAGQASSANPFMQPSAAPMMPQQSSAAAAGNPFNATFPPTSSSAYGGLYSQSPMTSYGGGGPAQQQSFAQFPQAQHQPPGGIYSQTPFSSTDAGYSSPFNNGSGAPASIGAGGGNPSSGGGIDGQLSNLVGKMGISGNGSESTPFGQPPMNNMMYGGGGMMPNGAYGIGGASQQPPQQQWNAFGGYNNVGGGGYMQQQQPPPNFGQPGGAYGMMNNGSNAFMAQQQPPQQQR